MIVKYKRARENKGFGKEKDTCLTLEKDYLVLGIAFMPLQGSPIRINDDGSITPLDNRMLVRILSDDDSYPIMEELKYFDIINDRIPENWTFRLTINGYHEIAPQALGGNFWEEYEDRFVDDNGDREENEATEVLDDVLRILHQFHDWKYPPKKKQEGYKHVSVDQYLWKNNVKRESD